MQVSSKFRLQHRSREHDSVDRLAREPVGQRSGLAALCKQDHAIAKFVQHIVKWSDEVRVEGVRDVGHDHADATRQTSGETAPDIAGHVSQFPSCLEDALARGCGNMWVPAQGA